jgi:hypothetical protein
MNTMAQTSATQRPSATIGEGSTQTIGLGSGRCQKARTETSRIASAESAIVVCRDSTVAEIVTGARISTAKGL